MVTLAVYAASLGGLGYTSYFYWTDFSTPAELFLVFGAFASWPVLNRDTPVLSHASGDAEQRDDAYAFEPEMVSVLRSS